MKRHYFIALPLLASLLLCSCGSDDDQPRIDSVWLNMVSRPVEQVESAYAGQTVCLHGEHFDDLRRVIVNGTNINLNTLFVYESDHNITFQLPADVSTTGDYIRVVTRWGMADYPFVVRSKDEQPEITSFSSTTLVPGTTLEIKGSNLGGATEVWLPLVFDGRALCSLDPAMPSDDTRVYVVVPRDVIFASGRAEIVMQKHDALRGTDFTDKAYSPVTDFRN